MPNRPHHTTPPPNRPTHVSQSAPQKARRPGQKRRLRPAAVALIVIMLLLLCAIVFLVTYQIAYHAELDRLREEAAQSQNDSSAGDTQTEGSTAPQSTGEQTPEPTPEPDTDGEPEVTFASLSEIVTYVDGLGIDFTDLASFDMSDYFLSATLKQTEDAGSAYQNETVYIGDSLVLHMTSRSDHPKDMVYGAASINPEDACVKKLTALKNGTEATFAEAMAELQPKRIVLSIGTNSMWMEPDVYVQFFSRFIDQLKAACPNTQLILQSTPPLTAEYEAGKNFPTNEKINRFNMYLAGLATYHDIWYLNSAADLKNAEGTLDQQYNSDGFHISAAGYDVWAKALRTHAITLQK